MSLEIRKGDSSENSWIIRYGSDGKDERRYSLRPADSLGKHWIIDEKNGILLDFFHESNTLTGAFSVQNATLVTKYSKLKKRLIFEVISKRSEPARISGAGTEESPEIKTYKITAIRSAELKKID
ncbi:MAG: hypothetical protein N2747_10735 [Chitinophagaceae bacterium]|nr:hypothetical protein [Chitinophagaceae bacterium]